MKIACLIAALLVAGCGAPTSTSPVAAGGPPNYAWKGAVIVDVRTPQEYAAGHVPGATSVPVAEVAQRMGLVVPDKDAPVLVYCRSGRRSAQAAQTLRGMGYTRVSDLGSMENARRATAPTP